MPNPTGYYRPKTVNEAVRLLSQTHIEAVLLSGGALKLAESLDPSFEAVIDVQDIEDISSISTGADGALLIGAGAKLENLVNSQVVPPILRSVIKRTLTWNQRNAISIAEAIEYASDVPEIVAVLLTFDAVLVFALPEERRVLLSELNLQVTQPRLPGKGLIMRIELPAAGRWNSWGTACVSRTPADKAIVSAHALVQFEQRTVAMARLVLTGVSPEPALNAQAAASMLEGHTLDQAQISHVVSELESHLNPVGDHTGSESYRKAMAAIVTRRALQQCAENLSE